MTTPNDPVQVRAIIASPIRECWGPGSPHEHVAMRIIAALKANRIALVKLPEPEEREEDEAAVGWPSVALHRVLVWDDYPGEVHFDYDLEPEEPMSPGEARELAAALLAAADAAEGEQ